MTLIYSEDGFEIYDEHTDCCCCDCVSQGGCIEWTQPNDRDKSERCPGYMRQVLEILEAEVMEIKVTGKSLCAGTCPFGYYDRDDWAMCVADDRYECDPDKDCPLRTHKTITIKLEE